DGHRRLARAEIGNLLRDIVFEDTEVAARNIGNEAALIIENGHIDIDYARINLEVRLLGSIQLVFASELGRNFGLLRFRRLALLARTGDRLANVLLWPLLSGQQETECEQSRYGNKCKFTHGHNSN